MKEAGPREQWLREQREANYAARNKPRNTPEASGTARKAPSSSLLSELSRNIVRASPPSQAKATKGKAGMAVGTPHVRRSTAGTGLQVGAAGAVQPATSEIMDATAGETAPNLRLKAGRPKKGEKRAKPWEAAGISKASWYRQKKAPK